MALRNGHPPWQGDVAVPDIEHLSSPTRVSQLIALRSNARQLRGLGSSRASGLAGTRLFDSHTCFQKNGLAQDHLAARGVAGADDKPEFAQFVPGVP
jgi:hypothetical protein